jgi:hypothetical protein
MANQPIKAHFSHKLRDNLFVNALLLTDKPFLKKYFAVILGTDHIGFPPASTAPTLRGSNFN